MIPTVLLPSSTLLREELEMAAFVPTVMTLFILRSMLKRALIRS